jgi:hypothetical protein
MISDVQAETRSLIGGLAVRGRMETRRRRDGGLRWVAVRLRGCDVKCLGVGAGVEMQFS